MKIPSPYLVLATVLFMFALFVPVIAQETPVILTPAELTRTMPPGFYFQGLSAPTQMRNSAAVKFGGKRYVLAGLVDTSGYAAEVRSKYQGFLITDSSIKINGTALAPGAYGFGFSSDGKLTVLDLTATDVLSVSTTKDNELRRPRPLMMSKTSDGVRLYSGKDYVVITAN
jgi:hypothetical protein